MPLSSINGSGLAHLEGLTAIESLDLSGTSVNDKGLDHLKGLTNLRELNLGARYQLSVSIPTQVTDAGVKKLQEALPKCRIHR